MLTLETVVGFVAAFCTTVSYVPQVRKCWRTGSTGDLSLKMILLLAAGISLWLVYGIMKGDLVIMLANGASLCSWRCCCSSRSAKCVEAVRTAPSQARQMPISARPPLTRAEIFSSLLQADPRGVFGAGPDAASTKATPLTPSCTVGKSTSASACRRRAQR
jgi:MtN3 and saliva related transmembrane protein